MTGHGTGGARGSRDPSRRGPVRDGAGDDATRDEPVRDDATSGGPDEATREGSARGEPGRDASVVDGSADDGSLPSWREEFRRMNERAVSGRWASKRRAKIHAELERNRNKDYKVPTWVLGLVLVVVVVGWALLIALS